MGFQYQLQAVNAPAMGTNLLQQLPAPDGREWRIREVKLREGMRTESVMPASMTPGIPTINNSTAYHDLLILWELYEEDQ